MTHPLLEPETVLRLGAAASAQFADGPGILFKVIRVHDWPTRDGWVWIDGYQLDIEGSPVSRRSVHVRTAGLTRPRSG